MTRRGFLTSLFTPLLRRKSVENIPTFPYYKSKSLLSVFGPKFQLSSVDQFGKINRFYPGMTLHGKSIQWFRYKRYK